MSIKLVKQVQVVHAFTVDFPKKKYSSRITRQSINLKSACSSDLLQTSVICLFFSSISLNGSLSISCFLLLYLQALTLSQDMLPFPSSCLFVYQDTSFHTPLTHSHVVMECLCQLCLTAISYHWRWLYFIMEPEMVHRLIDSWCIVSWNRAILSKISLNSINWHLPWMADGVK